MCDICDDTGWKAVVTQGVRRVERCDCWREGLTARLLEEARVPPRYRRCDLDTFKTYPNERLLTAVKQARRFADEFPAMPKGLCLIGPPGIGKTQDFTLKERIGFRIHSRLHEMCEFLEFDGADFRHAPTNAGPEDLLAMWKRKAQNPGRRLPARSKGPVRAQLRPQEGKGRDLGWTGGKAGS